MPAKYLGSVTFTQENDIQYGQDFSQWRGIPVGIRFEVFDVGSNLKLVGRGYGDMKHPESYGNGALYVSKARYRLESNGGRT